MRQGALGPKGAGIGALGKSKGGDMKSHGKFFSAIVSMVLLSSACYAATVTGTVKGPDGAAFQGAQTRRAAIALKTSLLEIIAWESARQAIGRTHKPA